MPLLDQLLNPSDPSAPLSRADRDALIAALRELAVAQALIARQALLLDSFGTDQRVLESNLRAALADAARISDAPAPDDGFDFTAAAAARAELTRQVNSAANLRDLLAAALGFIKAVA